jgi:hypothetical protein
LLVRFASDLARGRLRAAEGEEPDERAHDRDHAEDQPDDWPAEHGPETDDDGCEDADDDDRRHASTFPRLRYPETDRLCFTSTKLGSTSFRGWVRSEGRPRLVRVEHKLFGQAVP